MKAFIRFFSSVKLAIALLIILTAASILGTLIPQGRSAAEYAARYGGLAGILVRFQFTDLYHSLWFIALLGFFGLNTAVCTLTRLSPKLRRARRPQVAADPKSLAARNPKDRFRRSEGLPAVRTEAEEALRAAGYRVRSEKAETRVSILGRKRIAGIFGPDVVHLGLLVLLAGGIVSGLGGFKTQIVLREGETAPVPKAAFEIRLDKFTTEYYPDGSVKDWTSAVTVLEDNAPLRTADIEVNHPLSHGGFNFYQMSYGFDWETASVEVLARKSGDPGFLKALELKPGERAPLGDAEGTEIFLRRFLPDFVLGEGNRPETRSFQPNNPAVLIEGIREGRKVFEGWVFANFPDFARMHGTEADDLAFELKGFRAGQYSVLEAARDPGVPLIWAGCLLVMVGLGLAFYWPTCEIRAVLEEAPSKTEVVLGGQAAKGRDRFEKEFAAVAAALRRSS
ncbi:MAG: cytochrome c biogenesis protein ResB [Candidatus Aminicenantes bacterium]|nr:cytochrome c biogenesis protein ResB [Candidatus Aminicenantes bacterium]